ncbi:MAG TPA: right-handed parallel beta-helix repeat-containing protein [Novosphingobium sp.]|nr:right-handed parallel beta-helix repeat-containing protein [Novosphingobium sp.]
MKHALLPLLLAMAATPAAAQSLYQKGEPYLVVETGVKYQRLQDALFAIGDHTGTIRIAPGTYRDCGVQVEGNVTFIAQVPGKTTFWFQSCENKAALVLRGRSARVEGLVFDGIRLPEGNGAGIRLEKGDLTVVQSWFRNGDEGILAANDPHGQVTIDHATFTHLGRCDRGLACAHSIYINFYDRVTVTNTRFEMGDGGHYLKVRAGHVSVLDNSFDDSGGRGTNYMIDLPAGSTGRILRNWFVQGRSKENPTTLIAVAAEGHEHSSDGLVIESNVARFAPGAAGQPAFVGDWSGDRILVGRNQLAPGIVPYQRRR